MVKLDGGEFFMGSEDGDGFPADGEGPVRKVAIRPFYIDETAVTNQQFIEFARSTNYRTEAERFGWSFVFYQFVPARDRAADRPRRPRCRVVVARQEGHLESSVRPRLEPERHT